MSTELGLNQPGARELLEQPEYRVEGYAKTTGGADYAADLRMPGALWARFLFSPIAHGRIVSIDTRTARALPGVHAVLTGADIGAKRFGKVLYDWPALAYQRVLYIGERVAAVAAETREIAEEAVQLIRAEYEELPALLNAEDSLAPDAPQLHPDAANYYYEPGKRPATPHPNLQGYRLIEKGERDIEQLFAQAPHVFEDTFTAMRQHQAFIEPRACLVWIDEGGTVHVRSTNKSPFGLRHQISVGTGLPESQIIVDCPFIGGDFGGKGHSVEEFACYFLAKASGRPVRCVMTYSEELTSAAPRHGGKFFLRTAVSADGAIIAHQSRTYYDDGAYAGARPIPGPMLDGWSALEVYKVPNARLETFMAYTNTVPGGQMRAPGAAHTGFIGEVHINRIAIALGIDPLEFRLRNVIREGDRGLEGELFRNPRAAEVLETLRRETDWGRKTLLPNHGRGISLRCRHVGQGHAEVLLRLLPGGRIEAVHGAPDQGGGSSTVVKRVSAAILSVDQARISVRYATTAEAGDNPGAGASRLTHVMGRAIQFAATNLKDRLEELAAEVMGWPAGEVSLENDHFSSADGAQATFQEVADRILQSGGLEAFGDYDSAQNPHDEGGDQNFTAYMIEVEVDPATGRVRPVEAVDVVDVGQIINPIAHQGQLDGGFVFGLGNALMEELIIDEGKVATANLGDYRIPSQMDVPPLRTVLVPTDIGPGPFGAKGVGELVNNAVTPAVINAVYDAVGVHISTMPVTAERVYDALQAKL